MLLNKNEKVKEFYEVVAIGYDHCLYEVEDYESEEQAIERSKELISKGGRHTCRIKRHFRKDGHLFCDSNYRCYLKLQGNAW